MSIEEIQYLQGAGHWDAIGPLLAAYANGQFYKDSLVYRNLTACSPDMEMLDSSICITSPTRVSTKAYHSVAPKIYMCAAITLPMNKPMDPEKYDDIMSSLKVGVDRLFCTVIKAYKNIELDELGLPQFFRESSVRGRFYFSGISCGVPPDPDGVLRQGEVSAEKMLRYGLREPHYEVRLLAELSLMVEHVVVPEGWRQS